MGLPKTGSAPTSQMLLPAGQQVHAQLSGRASEQDSHATEGSLDRQNSLPSQPPVSSTVIGKAVSMPAGSSSMLRAYAAGALQSPVEEGQEHEPSSPQRHVLGKAASDLTNMPQLVHASCYTCTCPVLPRLSRLLFRSAMLVCYGLQSTGQHCN